ncbi:TPA: PIN domain-containing protein [Candidatus Bathyarchaeota archaeon]|nr:PIN domain-containing protein [Candidatus Bathyarchaeota archaeon]
MQELPSRVLIEADFFISYLRGDELADKVERLMISALEGKITLFVSSEVYDDIITAYRCKGFGVEQVKSLLADIRSIPHEAIPVTNESAVVAMQLYSKHGGGRRLHYFDSFHVATALLENLPLITSDRYILEKSSEMKIRSIDLRRL